MLTKLSSGIPQTRQELEDLTKYIHGVDLDDQSLDLGENYRTESSASASTVKNAGAEQGPEESEQAFTSEFDEELEAELYHSSMTSESSCSCESCASSNYTSCSCGCNDPTHDEDDTEDCLGDQSEEQMSSLM